MLIRMFLEKVIDKLVYIVISKIVTRTDKNLYRQTQKQVNYNFGFSINIITAPAVYFYYNYFHYTDSSFLRFSYMYKLFNLFRTEINYNAINIYLYMTVKVTLH